MLERLKAKAQNKTKKIKQWFSKVTNIAEFFIILGILITVTTTAFINIFIAMYILAGSLIIVGVVILILLLRG